MPQGIEAKHVSESECIPVPGPAPCRNRPYSFQFSKKKDTNNQTNICVYWMD